MTNVDIILSYGKHNQTNPFVSFEDCLETQECDLCESHPRNLSSPFVLNPIIFTSITPPTRDTQEFVYSSIYVYIHTQRTCTQCVAALDTTRVYVKYVRTHVRYTALEQCEGQCVRPGGRLFAALGTSHLACTQSVLAFSLGHGRSGLCCDRWCNGRGRYGAQPAPAPQPSRHCVTLLTVLPARQRTTRLFNAYLVNKNIEYL